VIQFWYSRIVMNLTRHFSIGIFSTGRGENSKKLLRAAFDATQRNYIPAEISFVFCNRERGEHDGTDEFLDLVESYGIPLITLSFRKFRSEFHQKYPESGDAWRSSYDQEILNKIEKYKVDVIALAGYMLIFSKDSGITERYSAVNLHPSRRGGPIGTWQEVIWQLHLTTEELDRGPVVTYCAFRLQGNVFDDAWKTLGKRASNKVKNDEGEENLLFKSIREEHVRRESFLFVETLRSLALGLIKLDGLSVRNKYDENIDGYDLTNEIEAKL
jgi:phosphoribosylglycinamide formyltransferase-1